MKVFTCPTCKTEWPENYCPECAQTIVRPLAAPKPSQAGVPLAGSVARSTGVKHSPNVSFFKGHIFGGIVFLCLGLAAFAFSFLWPIHWAEHHPRQTVTIFAKVLWMGPMFILGGLVVAAGFGENKIAVTISCGLGLVIGILLQIELTSILNKIANEH